MYAQAHNIDNNKTEAIVKKYFIKHLNSYTRKLFFSTTKSNKLTTPRKVKNSPAKMSQDYLNHVDSSYCTSQPALGFCQPFSGGASPAFQQWSVSSTSPSLKVDQSSTFLKLFSREVLYRLM